MVCGAATSRQLGRAVGGGHEERHLRLVRLDDGGVAVGGGGAARAQQHGRAPGGEAEPQGEERRRSLVVVDVDPDPGRRRQRQGQRRRTGPGATTASVTPARTHSSTSVAQKVAATVTGTAHSLADHGPGRRAPAAIHVERRGVGPRLVLVHGFTQTGPVVAADRRRPGRRPRGGASSTPPATAPPATARAGLRRGAEASSTPPAAGRSTSATRWALASCLHLALAHPDSSSGWCCRRDGRHRGARRAGRPPVDRRGAWPPPGVRRRRRLPRAVARPTAVRPPPTGRPRRRRPPSQHRRRARLIAARRRHRRRARRWAAVAAIGRCRCSCWRGPSTRSSRPSAGAWPPPSARTPASRLVPDAGHAAHLEQPAAFVAIVRSWLGGT